LIDLEHQQYRSGPRHATEAETLRRREGKLPPLVGGAPTTEKHRMHRIP
jgi:hypothetical protein